MKSILKAVHPTENYSHNSYPGSRKENIDPDPFLTPMIQTEYIHEFLLSDLAYLLYSKKRLSLKI